jgi:hypothetical protein
MASGQKSPLSSIFDGMLAHNRERLDALLREERGGGLRRSSAALLPRATLWPSFDASGSEAARYLRDRFADRWHYEIAARHRDGAEAVVLGRLVVDDLGTVKTQFGRAAIAAGPVAGRSGTVRFNLGSGSTQAEEEDAYRRAAEDALARCVKLL